jgi:hypothetical protein
MPELSPQFWMNWWVQLAVALCTLLAVPVALFGQGFRAKFFPPRLSLTVADPDGEKTKVRITWTENNISKERLEDARYYRLSVSNARHWSPANQSSQGSFDPRRRASRRRPIRHFMGRLHFVDLEYLDDFRYPESEQLLWEVEATAEPLGKTALPSVDASRPDNPTAQQAFVNAHRWPG